MAAKYIFRLDDICPTMNWDNFNKLEKIFDKYNIKPILGIIPDNRDAKLNITAVKEDFWNKMKELSQKRWIIAQHGYQHQYITKSGGILKINDRSEFADIPYQEQLEKIKKGKEILESKLGTKIEWWMAPAHSFDENTCKVLRELDFKYITDGLALFPFEKYGLVWIPQQLWKPRKKIFGVWTICIHPNTINDAFISSLEPFIKNNVDNFKMGEYTYQKNIFNVIYKYWWKFKFTIYKLITKKI